MDTSTQNAATRSGNYWPTVALVLVAAAVGFVIGRGTTGGNTQGLASVSESGLEEKLGIPEGAKTNVATGGEIKAVLENSVAVKDQPVGSKVVIEKLTLTKESWVAIHDVLPSGPGWILGAQKFPMGNYDGFTVNLRRPTEPGKKYVAMIHISNGDGEFNFRAGEADGPFIGPNGKPVMTEFQNLGN